METYATLVFVFSDKASLAVQYQVGIGIGQGRRHEVLFGRTDSWAPNQPTPKIHFLLRFRPLCFENVRLCKKKVYVSIFFLLKYNKVLLGGTSPVDFSTAGDASPRPLRFRRPWYRPGITTSNHRERAPIGYRSDPVTALSLTDRYCDPPDRRRPTRQGLPDKQTPRPSRQMAGQIAGSSRGLSDSTAASRDRDLL